MKRVSTLLHSTVKANDLERQSIANALRNDMAQSLTGMKLSLQTAVHDMAPGASEKSFTDHFEKLDSLTQDLYKLGNVVVPETLIRAGLVSATHEMLHNAFKATNIAYSFEDFRLGKERFSEAVEMAMYQIAHELVLNIIKHSKARACTVQLYQVKDTLILHIEDDGKGFDFDTRMTFNSNGLNRMLAEAEAIHAHVNFEKAKPRGTIVTVRVKI